MKEKVHTDCDHQHTAQQHTVRLVQLLILRRPGLLGMRIVPNALVFGQCHNSLESWHIIKGGAPSIHSGCVVVHCAVLRLHKFLFYAKYKHYHRYFLLLVHELSIRVCVCMY